MRHTLPRAGEPVTLSWSTELHARLAAPARAGRRDAAVAATPTRASTSPAAPSSPATIVAGVGAFIAKKLGALD